MIWFTSTLIPPIIADKYFTYFWGASGDFAQNCWDVVYEAFGSNEFALAVWGTFLFTSSLYWILGLCYSLIDWTGRPASALKYKIQSNASFQVPFGKVIQVVLFNQIFVGIPFFILAYYLLNWRGYDSGKDLPPFWRIVLEVAFCVLMAEIGFYYSHRLLHHRRIYKHIHKMHHEWTSPTAISAMYCHPVEHLVSNLMSVLLGPLLLGSHMFTSWLWFSLIVFNTLNSHCGFHFPFLPSPENHDFHHLNLNENYGGLGILDKFHGTDSEFLKSKASQRHFLSTSFVPVKQLYPDS
uniref:Fatty acid hydroxylase domain-containing protein 2 n=1 Tax=Araneus ventricosus TaxID=182803 RepID=A0A4Y2RQ08_ARAVE|nr:Fatty acid hydroxylase domain-containing protein 2 [Araneus ventricosus]